MSVTIRSNVPGIADRDARYLEPKATFQFRRAFTLLELLVVIAIIGLLIAMLLPAIQAAREAARRSTCIGKLNSLSYGLHNYLSARSRFPEGAVMQVSYDGSPDWCTKGPADNYFGYAPWTVLVLPFIEEQSTFDRFDVSQPFSRDDITCPEPNRQFVEAMQIFQCPSDGQHVDRRNSNYYGVAGGGDEQSDTCPVAPHPHYRNGILFVNSRIAPKHVLDGTSKTFLLGETIYADKWNMWWTSSGKSNNLAVVATVAGCIEPPNLYSGPDAFGPPMVHRGFSSRHPGGAVFVLADGSTNFYTNEIDVDVYQAHGSRNDRTP